MAKRAARQQRRGAGPALEARIRNEVGAIAVVAFAMLSAVALLTDQGALLHWWRDSLFAVLGWGAILVPLVLAAAALELWFGFLRREAVLPIAGGTIVILAVLGLARHYLRDDLAGGVVGGTVTRVANSAFGDVGAPIALIALLLVGVVIAANRTLADLLGPGWRRRDLFTGGLRPGRELAGGTAPKFARIFDEPGDLDDEPVRINLPEPRAAKPAQARLLDAALPKPLEPAAAAPLTPSIAGLPSAAVAAEGVLHATAPEKPWALPSIPACCGETWSCS